jgi:hypothetical protein
MSREKCHNATLKNGCLTYFLERPRLLLAVVTYPEAIYMSDLVFIKLSDNFSAGKSESELR